MNLQEFKIMAEICGYASDSITFWYKCGKYGRRWRLISTDFEAYAVSKYKVYIKYLYILCFQVRRNCSEVQQENMKQREVGQGEEMNSSWENLQQTQQSGVTL
ncbi:hypothetical protein RDI58_008609 [Solanum bulbocastanum]|uniref:Uncharacterized protein n=1 Tax=Solanum bulbocastanum TaxID=147425 RepID=A0AAN8U2S7_SOLBU